MDDSFQMWEDPWQPMKMPVCLGVDVTERMGAKEGGSLRFLRVEMFGIQIKC
jgi:hypothetical protein